MTEKGKIPFWWLTVILCIAAVIVKKTSVTPKLAESTETNNLTPNSNFVETEESHNRILKLADETTFGWNTSDVDFYLSQGSELCTIERILEEELTPRRFAEEFWRKKPVILLREQGINKVAQDMTQKEALLNSFGNNVIPLAKLESYAFRDEQSGSLKDYIETISKQDVPSNTTRFAFSTDQFGVGKEYIIPSVLTEIPNLLDPSFQVAIAGSGTGLAFHWHADVFAETLHGARRWFLFPPHTSPEFNPRSLSAEWVRTIRSSQLHHPTAFQECTLNPNEAIYVPADWFHSTLSLGEAVSITTSYATTYRRDRYHITTGASDNAHMLDAFARREFIKASQFADQLIRKRPKNFVPYSWMGVILTMDAMERHTGSLGEFRNALQLAHDATLSCIQLNPYFCPCYVWSIRQLTALSYTYKEENESMEQLLLEKAQEHEKIADSLSSAEDDEMLDPGWQPKSMNAARRKQRE